MKKILLNWLPPAMVNFASPAMSVLKGYLRKNGYQVDVKYWNIALNNKIEEFFNFQKMGQNVDIYKFLPVLTYLSVENDDHKLQERLRYTILMLKPQLNSKPKNFIDDYIHRYHREINELIDNQIDSCNTEDYLYMGFSTQFSQWIFADIIIRRILRKHPKVILISGGSGTEKQAQAMLRNFPYYSYAFWGESEHSLLQLTRYLDESYNEPLALADIPNVAYLKDSTVQSNRVPNVYIKLEELEYDFQDFVEQYRQSKTNISPSLPLEKVRGCHWRKCHFCYLNSGYKFRVKSSDRIIQEIVDHVARYRINNFSFVDNDIIGRDMTEFNLFLDRLIQLRSDNQVINIDMAEVVTKDITAKVIEKMSLAGFKYIQMGYESPSGKLLNKIDKKNTFASNLLCVKWCLYYGIILAGVNVIRNLFEETDEDVKEAIRNLHFLRFYLKKGIFYHNMSLLSIAENSRYYQSLQPKQLEHYSSDLWQSLPQGYIHEEDKFVLVTDYTLSVYNRLWDVFESVEEYYLKNRYSYSLMQNNGVAYYREFYNSHLVKELEFERKTSIHWGVLEQCNQEVRSIEELRSTPHIQALCAEETLDTVIEELSSEGLLYSNDDKSQLVTVINTDLLPYEA